MLRLFMDNYLFFSFDASENPENFTLFSMQLKSEINTLSQLSITTLFNHPRLNDIKLRRSTFLLADDNECLFIGKALTMSRSMSNEVQIEIEDLLGFLRDQIRPGEEYSDRVAENSYYGNNLTVETNQTYRDILLELGTHFKEADNYINYEGYNSLFVIPNGSIVLADDVTSEGTYLDDKANDMPPYKDRLSIIYDEINAHAGGIFYTEVAGEVQHTVHTGYRNLLYKINSYTGKYTVAPLIANKRRYYGGQLSTEDYDYYDETPSFLFGRNLFDFDLEPVVSDPTTAISPTGTYKIPGSDDTRVVTANTSYSVHYIINENAKRKYGMIAKTMDFGYLGEFAAYDDAKNKLCDLAQEFVDERFSPLGDKITVTGIDPYYLGEANTRIRLLDIVHVRSVPHNINVADYCLSMEVDFFNHDKDRYVIGAYVTSNYLEYKATNIDQRTSEMVSSSGSDYRKETGGLYSNSSFVRGSKYM